MSILLIGGCGYIGSQLFLSLKENYNVDTVDIETYGNFLGNDNHKHDFRELSKNFLSNYKCVILLAGHSSVPMCKDARLLSFKNNIQNFVEILDKLTDQKFIYASSSSVYGSTQNLAVTENWAGFVPQTYYDLTKQVIDYYASLSNINYYALRFGTVNGFSPNLRVDLMINKMYETAINTGTIRIYNKNIYRPILGIKDLCRAVETIITNKEDVPGIYNVASFNSTVGEIASTIANVLPNTSVVDMGETPTYNFSIDTTKFETTFGFSFHETIETIVTSLRDNWDQRSPSIRV